MPTPAGVIPLGFGDGGIDADDRNGDIRTPSPVPQSAGRFDVAASHNYRDLGQDTAVVIIIDLRDFNRFTYALTTVTVTAGDAPSGGRGDGRALADVIAALDPDQPHDRWSWHADAVESLLDPWAIDALSAGRPR